VACEQEKHGTRENERNTTNEHSVESMPRIHAAQQPAAEPALWVEPML
jgi:hypothetical protein